MSIRIALVTLFLSPAVSLGSSLAGSLSDDIRQCREAVDEAGLMGDAEYTLDFIDDKGNRDRVITLEANVVGAGKEQIECRMTRSKINDVVLVASE